MKHHLFSILILLAALGFYALGSGGMGGVFLVLGVVHEAWFWKRMLRRP